MTKKTYITADTHFGFERILSVATRNFESIEAHDISMLALINSRAGRNDRLIIVGDFCHKNPQKWRSKISCREVWLVLGNHDKPSWANCFSRCESQTSVKLGTHEKLPVFFNHCPMAFWPGSHHGHGHVYGHTHGNREEILNQWMPERRSVDVGLDASLDIFGRYHIWDEDELVQYLLLGEGHDDLDFYHEMHRTRLANFQSAKN